MISENPRGPLDRPYMIVPGDLVKDHELPKEEFQVRDALLMLKLIYLKSHEFGFFSKMLRSGKYHAWQTDFDNHKGDTLKLICSTPQHRAAYHRIANSVRTTAVEDRNEFWSTLNNLVKETT